LDVHFSADGFDAVVLVGVGPDDKVPALAAELLARPEFAPIVLIWLEDLPLPPETPGLHRVHGRKIDRVALVGAVSASRDSKQLQAMRRHPQDPERYRFGSVIIRGHRFIRQVGSGGMCRIYLAESERAGALVVLKVFNQVPDVTERIVGFDRFLQEYDIVAALEHRNIVRIHDLGVADDHAYIAMEHFPAGDLRQRMEAPMTPAVALHFLEQIASALDAIHAVGVLHRDLKPANVMLRADGSPCLIDFGLAKTDKIDAGFTGTREIFGTPYYMSPEQGHAEEIDARSDLYSLGVVFYEMLTGKKPYTGASAMEVIYKHRRTLLPALAPELACYDGLLRRLLAKSPDERFQSARELLDAIAGL
jgi:serine/threonine protein kinase